MTNIGNVTAGASDNSEAAGKRRTAVYAVSPAPWAMGLGLKHYIGKSVEPDARLARHARRSSNAALRQAIDTNGAGAFRFQILAWHDLEFDALREELWWTDFLGVDNLYNEIPGGGGKGKQVSAETRGKLSAVNLGRKRTLATRAKISAVQQGKRNSAEAVAKMAAANRGGKRSPETRARMSAAQRALFVAETLLGIERGGKPLSAETRLKLSSAHKGKTLSAEHRAKLSESHKRPRAPLRASKQAETAA